MEMEADCVTVTVTVLDVAVTAVPDGGVPVTMASSTIEPWSMSA